MSLVRKEVLSIRFVYYIQIYLIFTIYWASLFESFSLEILTSGIAVSVISVYLSEKHVIHGTYYSLYNFNILQLMPYFLILLKEIYTSSFSVMTSIISGKAEVSVISIPTKISDDFRLSILANSITLTPGTITMDMKKGSLTVLWLNPQNDDPLIAGEIIKGRLERMLKEGKDE